MRNPMAILSCLILFASPTLSYENPELQRGAAAALDSLAEDGTTSEDERRGESSSPTYDRPANARPVPPRTVPRHSVVVEPAAPDRGRPTALGAGDFDGDGVQDLVCGYAGPAGHSVVFYRGNVDSIYPHSRAARERRVNGTFADSPFLTPARESDVSIPPDLLGVGDFDNDGNLDVVVARYGGETLRLLSGDGTGGLKESESISLPGALDAMVAGEINRADGLADLVVAVTGANGPVALIFEDPEGALRGVPEKLSLPTPATALWLGRLVGGPWHDLAVDTGDELLVVRGRDRGLLLGADRRDGAVASAEPWPNLERPPIAELALRLNGDALPDLVQLVPGVDSPVVALSAPLATIIVDSTSDAATAGDGICTLREAITNSNADADASGGDCATGSGVDTIAFAIDGGGSTATITLDSALPVVSDPVTIDGTTQGCANPPCVALDGIVAGAGARGLELVAGSSVIRGMVVHSFDSHGVIAPSSGNILEGNYIGTDLTGMVDRGNNGAGARFEGGASGNIVGGSTAAARNIISGNSGDGVFVLGPASDDNQILGNYIGTDVTGTLALSNALAGAEIQNGSNNTIGGTAAGARNIISSSGGRGVLLDNDADVSLIQGNYIGTDATGTVDLGNTSVGVRIRSSNNTIGGTAVAAGNLISGNEGIGGVYINRADVTVSGNEVLGNRIGTDATGTLGLGNTSVGVRIVDSPDNIVGGAADGARNVVSANGSDGIIITGINSVGNRVLGNFIGTDITGTADLGNAFFGVELDVNSSDTRVGGSLAGERNIISGNELGGVLVDLNSSSNTVKGNYIGTDVSGTSGLGNSGVGVYVAGFANRIGGAGPGERNVISANESDGVFITGGAANDNRVEGNFIGTDASGTVDLGNLLAGVEVQGGTGNEIGGDDPGERNIISGNDLVGILLESGGLTKVRGNYLGTDVTGTLALGNTFVGIWIAESSSNTIGGILPGDRNVISGNGTQGIQVELSSDNEILGNFIGTQADGIGPLGNVLHGVIFLDGSSDNTVGGTGVTPGLCDGPCNRIAYSQDPAFDGVRVQVGSGNGNAILGNAIHSCGELGIDLDAAGVTLNDPGDPDAGANLVQNFPVLGLAQATPSGVTVDGSLNSSPNRPFRVELFASAACDGSGYGEGARFLGFVDVHTDALGDADFSAGLTGPVSDGDAITATATSNGNSTSEFSECIEADCLTTATFGQTITASENSLIWPLADHVQFAKGDLAAVSSYSISATGELPGAVALDISQDDPSAGSGLWYLIRSTACGSWQTTPDAEPARDATLP